MATGSPGFGCKQVSLAVGIIVVAMAQNSNLRKPTEKVEVPVLDAVFIIVPAVTGHLQDFLQVQLFEVTVE